MSRYSFDEAAYDACFKQKKFRAAQMAKGKKRISIWVDARDEKLLRDVLKNLNDKRVALTGGKSNV